MGGVLDVKKNSQGPWYVVRKDVEENKLFVTNRYDEERFDGCRKEVGVEQVSGIESRIDEPRIRVSNAIYVHLHRFTGLRIAVEGREGGTSRSGTARG